MVFRQQARSRAQRREGFVAPVVTGVQRFLTRRVDTGHFGAARPRRGGSTAEQRPIEPGPLGIWERPFRDRPFQQVGKFGTNLMGSQGPGQPTQATPYSNQFSNPVPRGSAADTLRAWADPGNPENAGFFEGLLGGLFGMAGEGARSVGRFLGSGVDLPVEAAGNVLGLPGALLTGIPEMQRLDPDIIRLYDEAARENPINGVLLWSHAAKAQWQRDVEAGRRTGLSQDIGPAVALTDQLGFLLQSTLGLAARGSQRLIAGLGTTDEALRETERASREGRSVVNPAFQRLQQRLERGDFGIPGSQQARDAMLDQLIVEGSLLRDFDDPEQVAGEGWNKALPLGLTGQGLADIAFSVLTDPTILAGGIVGGVSKLAQAGRMTANAKFWQAMPVALRQQALDDVARVAMRRTGVSTPEEAWARMGRASELRGAARQQAATLEQEVLREVASMPAYAEARGALNDAVDYLENWRTRWEPVLRPVAETVRNVNDPLRMFGVGRADRVADTIYSAHATEGIIRGAGSLDAHAHNVEVLTDLPEPVLAAYNRGLGVGAANMARSYIRNGLVKDARRIGGVPWTKAPEEIINERIVGTAAGDVATGLEKLALRVRPLYLATRRGGREEAIAKGRDEISRRMQMMGATFDQANAAVARMGPDELSLMDLAYFGHTTDEFVKYRAAAVEAFVPAPGALNPEELTILGPRQMTMQTAAQVLDAVQRGDVAAVREALSRYDVLFENISEGMSDPDLLRRVTDLVGDLVEHKALPSDLPSLAPLTPELRQWAERNADLGYRPGFRPADDQLWRVSVDSEGNVIGVNPWVDLAGTASEVGQYTRWQRAKDYLFHDIRGERIMADARVRMAQYTSERFGFTRAQSDAMFARVIRLAQEAGITPRGLSPEQVYGLFKSHRLDTETMSGIGVREAIEAVMTAFEGNLRHVGLSQKGTGAAKTLTGGQGNWIGQVAEKVYPLVRFTLNPLFQAQELTEPFILNIMRGIKPGFRASEMDERTLELIETLIRDSKYAIDDQIERTHVLLWGADSARNAFGSNTRLGRLVSKIGFLNVKEVKRVNMARALRRELGIEFEQGVGRVAPDLIPKLKAHYATEDMSQIAVRYLSEKSVWGTGGRAAQEARIEAMKPATLGARSKVNVDGLVSFFDDYNDTRSLRTALDNGTVSEEEFHSTLLAAGADEEYARRAYTTIRAPLTADEWWDEFRATLPNTPGVAIEKMRRMVQQRAEALGITEHELLSRVQARPWMPRGSTRFRPTYDFAAFQSGINRNTRAYNLSEHSPTEFAESQAFLSPDGSAGFMVSPEGDLQNVFNNSKVRGVGREGVEMAIAMGARTLDAYDGYLPGYYAVLGFRETGRMKFVDEFAPDNMDPEVRARKPDVVFMALTDDGTPYTRTTQYFDDWDEAKQVSRERSVERRGENPRFRPWVDPGPTRPSVRRPEGEELLPEDEQLALSEARWAAQRQWDLQIQRGVALGRLTADEAAKRGWRNAVGYDIALLPENLYHATSARDSILANGIKTREEMGRTALGGGPEDTVSFTTSREVADRIAETLIEASDLLNGRMTVDDLLVRAEQGGFDDTFRQLAVGGGSTTDAVADLWERTYVKRQKYLSPYSDEMRGGMALKSLDEVPEGWEPAGDSFIGGDGIERWGSFWRPMTDDEWDEQVFDAYRAFLQIQQSRGGPMDPLFFSPDVPGIKRINPAQVGVIAAHPKPGAQGYLVPSMDEWRTWTGDAVVLDDAAAGTGRLQMLLGDSDRLERALQASDPNTGLRIMADVFERDLDQSQRNVILSAYNEANGLTGRRARAVWNRDVSDWYVEQFVNYVRSPQGRGVTRTPPPAEGMVRVFRGEGGPAKSKPGGRWFSQSEDVARSFSAKGQRLKYVDLTPEEVEQFRTTQPSPDYAPGFTEFRLSDDAKQRQAVYAPDAPDAPTTKPNPNLRSSFEYFRKSIGRTEQRVTRAAEAKAMEQARQAAIKSATKSVNRSAGPLKAATKARESAERALAAAKREYASVRRRSSVDVLEGRWRAARDEVTLREVAVREAKERVRALNDEVTAARARAQEAAGTKAAGGRTQAVRRKEAAVADAERAVRAAESDLKRQQKIAADASVRVRAARRRTPVETYRKRVEAAQKKADKAIAKHRKAKGVADGATKALADAKAMPVKPGRTKAGAVVPPVSDKMRDMLNQIITPVDTSPPKVGPGSPVDLASHYNLQEEAAYMAAHHALSRAEENAFTLHYYKRGRSFVERSINHPYFGLYPASYMWGKVLPEMIRFLVRTPFGLDAPLGGLALSNNIYRQVMVQQAFDEQFRQEMVDKTDFFHLLALLTPSLPWEVPVNAPLWARRVAEADEVHQVKLASGDADAPLMDVDTFGELTREMMNYAFGPAAAATQVAGGISALAGAGSSAVNEASAQLSSLLTVAAAQPIPEPPVLGQPVEQPTIQLPQIAGTQGP